MSCDRKLFLIQFPIKAKTGTNNDTVQALHNNSHWRLGTFSACTDIFPFSSVSSLIDCFAKLKSSAGFYFLTLKIVPDGPEESKSEGRLCTKKEL